MVPHHRNWNVRFARRIHDFEDGFQVADRVTDRERSIEVLTLNIDDNQSSTHPVTPQSWLKKFSRL
jgi:hypothetical protein